MTQELVLTSDWPLERIMEYSPQITACLRKLRDKFPDDGTMDSYAQGIISGEIQLWIAFDDGEFKGVILTTIKVVEATGHRALIVADAAGIDGLSFVPLIGTLEGWAREQGLDSIQPVGRLGWKKVLAKEGYEIDRVTYRKAL